MGDAMAFYEEILRTLRQAAGGVIGAAPLDPEGAAERLAHQIEQAALCRESEAARRAYATGRSDGIAEAAAAFKRAA